MGDHLCFFVPIHSLVAVPWPLPWPLPTIPNSPLLYAWALRCLLLVQHPAAETLRVRPIMRPVPPVESRLLVTTQLCGRHKLEPKAEGMCGWVAHELLGPPHSVELKVAPRRVVRQVSGDACICRGVGARSSSGRACPQQARRGGFVGRVDEAHVRLTQVVGTEAEELHHGPCVDQQAVGKKRRCQRARSGRSSSSRSCRGRRWCW